MFSRETHGTSIERDESKRDRELFLVFESMKAITRRPTRTKSLYKCLIPRLNRRDPSKALLPLLAINQEVPLSISSRTKSGWKYLVLRAMQAGARFSFSSRPMCSVLLLFRKLALSLSSHDRKLTLRKLVTCPIGLRSWSHDLYSVWDSSWIVSVPNTLRWLFSGNLMIYSTGYQLWIMFMHLDSDRYPLKTYGDIAFRIYGPWARYTVNVLQSLQPFSAWDYWH